MNHKIVWGLDALVYDFFTGKVDWQLYREIIAALGNLESVKIDEFGCGTGNLTSRFPPTAIIRVVDYSPLAIQKTRQKTNGNVAFFLMDFYQERLGGYQPDKIVACRSLYNPDLSASLGILSESLGDKGLVVIAHPQDNLRKYITPQVNGKSEFDFTQFVKSLSRVANYIGFPYHLFSAEEFESAGKQHFDQVKVTSAGYDTHYLVQLIRGPISEKLF